MRKLMLAAAITALSATAAFADPVKLDNSQLDTVSAGALVGIVVAVPVQINTGIAIQNAFAFAGALGGGTAGANASNFNFSVFFNNFHCRSGPRRLLPGGAGHRPCIRRPIMKMALAQGLFLCLTGLASADPTRLSDPALDEVTAGELSDMNLVSAVQIALIAQFAHLSDDDAAKALREFGLTVNVGRQEVKLDGVNLMPLLQQLRAQHVGAQVIRRTSISPSGSSTAYSEITARSFGSGSSSVTTFTSTSSAAR
jgi:opacity protein-like surface antigen